MDLSVGPLKDELERAHGLVRLGLGLAVQALYRLQCESHLRLFSAGGDKCHITHVSIYCGFL